MQIKTCSLPDEELVATLRGLVSRSNRLTAEMLVHLAEVDARRLFAPAGFSSMFAWCVEVLGFSEGVAYKRIRAARTAREYPALIQRVASGELHLAAVALLAAHLTADNHVELMDAASGKTKRQIEQLLADRRPKPDVLGSVRKLPAPKRPRRESASPPPEPLRLSPPARPEPLGQQRYKVRFTADEALVRKLEHARNLMSHRHAEGDLAVIVGEALTLLCEKLEKERYGVRTEPSPKEPKPGRRRRIPKHVRRQVWDRDQGCCTYVGANGRRCSERRFLELHHQRPWAKGGQHTLDNVCLRCHAHNQLAAREDFGAGLVQASPSSPVPRHPVPGPPDTALLACCF